MRSVMIDHPTSWAKDLETDGTIEKFIGIDMSLDEGEIVRRHKLSEMPGPKGSKPNRWFVHLSRAAHPHGGCSGAVARFARVASGSGRQSSQQARDPAAHEASWLAVSAQLFDRVERLPNYLIEVAAECKADMTVMLEYYLDGPEIDCDIVMARGEPIFAEVSDNGPTVEPYFNETWGVCPSLLPKAQQGALKQL